MRFAIAASAVLALAAAACTSEDSGTSASTTPAVNSTMDIVDTAVEAGQFSTLITAVEAAGLTETLRGAGPFTVFAPTDEAFAALPEGTLDTLLKPANEEQLAGILTYHVVPSAVLAADVSSGSVTTLNGADFVVSTEDGVTIADGQGNDAQVVSTDIVTSNGVIHVIDAVLLPPA